MDNLPSRYFVDLFVDSNPERQKILVFDIQPEKIEIRPNYFLGI